MNEETKHAEASKLVDEAHERQHAPLSASGSRIWLNCPGSYRLTKDLPDESSVYAEEGTRAHAWCEYLLQKHVLHTEPEYTAPDDSEMEQCGQAYLDYVQSKVYEEKPYRVYAETRVDFSKVVPDGFGTCDCLIVGRDKLTVIDFKYGKGVKVDSYRNSQMQLYALGALHEFELIADTFRTVEMTIFQPRIDNVSTWTVTMDELAEFASDAHRRALAALEGKEKCRAGDWCKFCKANPRCRERAKKPLETIQKILDLNTKEKEK